PPTHTCEPLHAEPHAPQLEALASRLTQKPSHKLLLAGHLQAPWLQNVPPVQAMPHALQFALLVMRSTHEPLHSTLPTPQLDWQPPELHTAAAGQTMPQAPQSSVLEVRSTHSPSQPPSPAGQVHAPCTQIAFMGHFVAQAPQFDSSDCR